VEAFLQQNSNEFLAMDFQDVSLGDMIGDDAVRGPVKAVESAMRMAAMASAREAGGSFPDLDIRDRAGSFPAQGPASDAL